MTRYAYDTLNNLLSVTELASPTATQGRATDHAYDALNRLTLVTQAVPGAGQAPATTAYTYDYVGNVLTQTNSLTGQTSATTTYVYDRLNRRTTVTDATQGVTSFTYDANGNLLSVTDPANNKTEFRYDDLDRQDRETIYLPGPNSTPVAVNRTLAYDAAGNLTAVTDRNGRVRQFVYDNLDRVTQEKWLDQGNLLRTFSSTYDVASRLTLITEPDSSTSFGYDRLGRVVTASNAGTANVPTVLMAYAYDAASNVLSQAEFVNGQATATTTYAYDNLDRLKSEQQSGGVAPKRVDFAYNHLGQMTQVNRYADLAGTNLVVSGTYGYDGANRLTGITYQRGGTTLNAYSLSYDAGNRLSSKSSTADGNSAFQYDDRGELTSASSPGQTQSFGYDAAGNRNTTGYQTGPYNRMTSDGRYAYTYDNEGNRTRRTDTVTGATDDYTWDHRNRLTRVLSKTSSGAVTQDVYYTYDAFDQRIRKQVDSNGDGTFEVTEAYAHAGGHLALVFDGAGQVQERYLYGPGVDQPLAVERGGATQWLLGDDQGTVRDVVDAGGSVVNHLVVDAFGVPVNQTNAAVPLRFIYTGREYDQETGLYQYRRRYYDPKAGKFLSDDPSGFGAGDPNLSRYVGNSVTNLTDPSGLRPATPLEGGSPYVEEVYHSWRTVTIDMSRVPDDYYFTGQSRATWSRGDWWSAFDQPNVQRAVEIIEAGGAIPGGTAMWEAYNAEYWSNAEFRAYMNEVLGNRGQMGSGTGSDWIYDVARQDAQYRREFSNLASGFSSAEGQAQFREFSVNYASFVPFVGDARDVTEVVSGYDLATGEKLSWWGRGLTAVAAAIPIVPASAVRKGWSSLFHNVRVPQGVPFKKANPADVIRDLPAWIHREQERVYGVLVINEKGYYLRSGIGEATDTVGRHTFHVGVGSRAPAAFKFTASSKSAVDNGLRDHVEGAAASIMHHLGAKDATLYLNLQPCGALSTVEGCWNNLPYMLPFDSKIRVFFPSKMNGGSIHDWIVNAMK